MNGFIYTLTLEEPVLANSLGGDPNSADSLFYIPGSAVRGAAIADYQGPRDSAAEEFRRKFLDGRTRFLNAYPLIGEKRSLPAPLTWQAKRKPASGEQKVTFRQPDPSLDTKGVSFEFWTVDQEFLPDEENPQAKPPGAEILRIWDEEWQINVHTQRDAERGRATREAGAVYRYIALPAGMRLQGAVLAENEEDARDLQTWLNGKTILLGKARTAGYGHARAKTAPLPQNWRETGQTLAPASSFTLTLLSPAIVRDDNGQYSLDIVPALKAHLGAGFKLISSQRKSEIIGGFNRKWGLPLPHMQAISAGSVFEISGVSAEELLALEASGIGERRAEGFGCLAMNLDVPIPWHPTPDAVNLVQHINCKPYTPMLSPTADGSLAVDDPLATFMLTRLLRRDLDEQVLRCARAATEKYAGSLPNSQLSRWRVIIRSVMDERNLARLIKFATESKGKAGWTKMEKVRIDFGGQRPRLTEWIEALLADPDELKNAWEKDFTPQRSLGNVSVALGADLNAEYRLRLLDAVLAILSKKNSPQAANKQDVKGGANG